MQPQRYIVKNGILIGLCHEIIGLLKNSHDTVRLDFLPPKVLLLCRIGQDVIGLDLDIELRHKKIIKGKTMVLLVSL
jgi:hypothetical protein